MNLRTGALLTFFAQVLQFGLAFLTSVLIARTLGPAGKGVFTLLTVSAGIMVLIGSLGLGTANTYFAANRKYPVRELAGNSVVFSLTAGGAILTVMLGIYPYLNNNVLAGTTSVQIMIAAGALPFLLLLACFNGLILGESRVATYNALNVTQLAVFALGLLLLLGVGRITVLSAFSAWAIAAAVAGLASVIALSATRTFPGMAVSLRTFWGSIVFGLKGHGANLISFVNYRLDFFVVSAFLGAAQVGLYSVGVAMAELLWYVPNSVTSVLLPRISSSGKEEATRVTTAVCRHTLFLTLVCSALAIPTARLFLVLILTDRFLPSLLPFFLLLPGVISLSLSKVISSDLTGRGKPQYATLIAAITISFTVVLDLVLIPRFGIAGAAVASTLVYMLATMLSIAFFLHESNAALGQVLLFSRDDLAIYLEGLGQLTRRFAGLSRAPLSQHPDQPKED